MPKVVQPLTDKQFRTEFASKPDGLHALGNGLYVEIKGDRRRWVLRGEWGGARRSYGFADAIGDGALTLAQAREMATIARLSIKNGSDPVAVLQAEQRKAAGLPEALVQAVPSGPTFGSFADEWIETKKAEFRNEKHAAQWETTLGAKPYDPKKIRIDKAAHEKHQKALAALRAKTLSEIDTDDVLAVLAPIWTIANETASRVRGRIEAVLAAAKARKLRSGENPAVWKDHLENLLPKRQKLQRGHHAALPFEKVAEFVAALRARDAIAARALEFLVLTAGRSGEVLGAKWGEVDTEKGLWIIPPTRMKAGREHRVPLVPRALEIVEAMRPLRASNGPDAFLFPGQRKGKSLSPMALEMALRRMGHDEITVHGFRSSFRDWAGEVSTFPREIAEAALAHVVGDSTERAYRRGDALEKRRKLMEAWAGFVEPKAANVVAFVPKGA